jgi:PadR family transcriptional regulator, regulatory protein PadR
MLSKELVAASTVPLVLSVLAEGENYGYALIQRVRELWSGGIEWTEGMLYPVLHRMEDQGFVGSEWKKADTGRRRKYYRLRNAGRKALQAEQQQWLTVHTTLTRLWHTQLRSTCATPFDGGMRACRALRHSVQTTWRNSSLTYATRSHRSKPPGSRRARRSGLAPEARGPTAINRVAEPCRAAGPAERGRASARGPAIGTRWTCGCRPGRRTAPCGPACGDLVRPVRREGRPARQASRTRGGRRWRSHHRPPRQTPAEWISRQPA